MAVRKIGATWYIDYYASGTRHVQAVGPSKREAIDALGKVRAEIREGRFFDKKRISPTPMVDLIARYSEMASRRRGWETEEYHLRVILDHFGKAKIVGSLTLSDVEAFQAKRAKAPSKNGGPRANATINREVQVLQRLMNKAVDWDMASSNPVNGITYLEESAGRTRFLSLEEVKALLLASKGTHLRPVLICALTTGMRKEEVLGLLWSEVDLGLRLITLPPGRTKNGRGRHVPINPTLLATLESLPQDGPYVFWGKKRVRSIKRSWQTACRKAGIENFTFHDLRHTAVSYMVMAGVPMKVAGEVVGHSNTTMTDRYTHLVDEIKHKAVGVLPRWEEKDGTQDG